MVFESIDAADRKWYVPIVLQGTAVSLGEGLTTTEGAALGSALGSAVVPTLEGESVTLYEGSEVGKL